jgi:uncharacterized protein (DUF1330 family)
MVLVEFPSLEAARAWHASPEYAPALRIRQAAGNARVLALDGVQGPYTG